MYISVRLEISHIFPYLPSMYITTIPNRSSPPAILLRESYREDGQVKTRTLANLTHWPPAQLEALRRVLRGETLVAPEDAFEIIPTTLTLGIFSTKIESVIPTSV